MVGYRYLEDDRTRSGKRLQGNESDQKEAVAVDQVDRNQEPAVMPLTMRFVRHKALQGITKEPFVLFIDDEPTYV